MLFCGHLQYIYNNYACLQLLVILVARLQTIASRHNYCIYIISDCKTLVILVVGLPTIVSGHNYCIYIISDCKTLVIFVVRLPPIVSRTIIVYVS